MVDLFSSGANVLGRSVSNVFDTQYRSKTWGNASNDNFVYNNGSAYPVGNFRAISSLVLNDGYDVVEGLVVDTKDGGIGFRNHSAPPPSPYGGVWTEDLLFIRPVTQCVDTNLTLNFAIARNTSVSDSQKPVELWLIDKGGFSSLSLSFSRDPDWNVFDSITQETPEL